MTVLENLVVAQHNRLMSANLFSIAGLLGLPRYRARNAPRSTAPATGSTRWV